MISLQDSIKYIAIAAIIYFLLKAFAADKLKEEHIILLVVLIMALIIFIANQNFTCPNKRRFEGYQMTDTAIVNSVYPGPNNTNLPLDKPTEWDNTQYPDQDIQDMKDIMAIDKETYEKLTENEKKAIDKIRSNYTNEMVYTTTHPFNTIPLGTQLYGYTFLPPENWFRAYERPPVCITDKKCPVCPIADATTSGLMEFDASNNILGPDGIDVRYVKKILNRHANNSNNINNNRDRIDKLIASI